jgi:hypothetical protein
MISVPSSVSLYEQDYVEWLDVTLEQLQNRDLKHLDWTNLIEEVEALGSEQRHKVESYLIQLLKHLLLYQYWESEKLYCAKGWKDEIDIFRIELAILLRSKTLSNYTLSILENSYQRARCSAKTKSDLNIFPVTCPYSMEQILDPDWFP